MYNARVDKELTQANPEINWREVFEQFGDDENALLKARAAHRVALGTMVRAAQDIGVSTDTVKGWMKNDPNFKRAVELIRDNVASFVDNGLQTQVASAVAYFDWIMNIDPTDSKHSATMQRALLGEQGTTARELLRMIDKRRGAGTTINAPQAVFHITESAAKILTDRNPVIDITPDEEEE